MGARHSFTLTEPDSCLDNETNRSMFCHLNTEAPELVVSIKYVLPGFVGQAR